MTKKERFDHLFAVTSSPKFLGNSSFVQDIPFFICPYPANEANEIKTTIRQLITKLKEKNIKVKHLNLYDICLELLEVEEDLAWLIEEEENLTKRELKETLQNILDVEKYVIPKIGSKLVDDEHDIIFVSGMGEVYPYIRAHNFLNNLQTTIKNKPMLMFFPGEYRHTKSKGSVLELFGRLKDDRYYRAFNIFDIDQGSLGGVK
ncbi:DUF1788 domain-containing protein [bacterium]|nr:DUF1788 domain-containing protein [bacterium]